MEEFLNSVRDGSIYDAVLMDIDWEGECSGLWAAEELYNCLLRNYVLVVRANGAVINIPTGDICFIESEKHIVHIHTDKECVVVYEKLSNVLDKLPECFCQCHKSYLVNMQKVRRFQGNNILLKNGNVIPVSRSRNVETREQYVRFIGQEI